MFRWKRGVAVLTLLLTANSGAFAQDEEKAARQRIEQALAEVQRDPKKGSVEAERLLREALDILRTAPRVSRERIAEASVLFSMFMLGEKRSADSFRAHLDEAIHIYENATPPIDDARLALALETRSASPDIPTEQAESLKKRSTIIRQRSVEALRAQDEGGSAQPSSAVRRIGGGVTPPRIREKQEPHYTEDARIARRQGTALLSIVIDTSGKPRNIRLHRSLGFGLDEAAYQAVKTWLFNPATEHGEPVAVTADVEVNFRLL